MDNMIDGIGGNFKRQGARRDNRPRARVSPH
jgi:hypothetical protein